MTFWPDFDAVDAALADVAALALAEDLPTPVAPDSIYFGPADDPRAPRPSCRIFRGPVVQLGRGDHRSTIPQAQRWRLTLEEVAAGDYVVEVAGAPFVYAALPTDDLDAIQAGLLAALAPCPDATSAAVGDELDLLAVVPGKHLAVAVSPNLSARVTADRKLLKTSSSGELTVTFQLATLLDSTSPSGSQHAIAYATLLRARLWHPDVLGRLRSAGIAPLRVASGPLAGLDEREGAVTETRATVQVVFSVPLGATSRPPFIESATPITGDLA